jgi:hypothetical protein
VWNVGLVPAGKFILFPPEFIDVDTLQHRAVRHLIEGRRVASERKPIGIRIPNLDCLGAKLGHGRRRFEAEEGFKLPR